MNAPASSDLPSIKPRLRLESCRVLLRQLCEAQPPWAEIAGAAARDPLLSWAILSSLPLPQGLDGQNLTAQIESRLDRLGADLLRAWILGASLEASDSPALEKRSSQAILVAELALHLAQESGYRAPQEAYLAGLWHELAALFEDGDPNGLEDGNPVRRAERSMRLAGRAAPGLPVLDAIRLHVEGEECIGDSHALTRILWVACTLAEARPERALASLSHIIGLPARVLLELREDVTYMADDALRESAHETLPTTAALVVGPQEAQAAAGEGRVAGSQPWIGAASRGLMQSAFIEVDEALLCDRLYAGCALLTGAPGPQLVLEEVGDRLQPVLAQDLDTAWLDGMSLGTANPNSTLALALRRGDALRYSITQGPPGRSTVDWQLSRWLGCTGFTAWPWQIGQRRGIALFTDAHSDDCTAQHRDNLLVSALGELLRSRRRLAESRAREQAAQHQFDERARRMRHEASSPLSLIRNYLDLIRERHGADDETGEDLAILGSEIDRVDQMLRRMSGAPMAKQETARCQVNHVLRDLAALCTDTLFASRGLRLDLRLAAQLPAVGMPSSILRQILLNLLRNAAEALPEGGRVTLASGGPVSVDGRLCVEIRVIDNGPGLPAGRLERLYADGQSDKGGHNEGIGLSIVRDLLHEYEAAMICRSQPRAGTGMQIFIPVLA